MVASVVAARSALWSDDLVAWDRAQDDYARLVTLSESACQAGRCAFAWGDTDRPPPEVRRTMARVRARDVRHDPTVGETTIRGGYGAAFSLVYARPPSPAQRRARAARAHLYADAPAWQAPPARHDLGGGWARVERR